MLCSPFLRVARVTAGLAESNGSLPPGLWITSPAGWLLRTGISSRTLCHCHCHSTSSKSWFAASELTPGDWWRNFGHHYCSDGPEFPLLTHIFTFQLLECLIRYSIEYSCSKLLDRGSCCCYYFYCGFAGEQVKYWQVVCTESCGGISHSWSLPSLVCHLNYGQCLSNSLQSTRLESFDACFQRMCCLVSDLVQLHSLYWSLFMTF